MAETHTGAGDVHIRWYWGYDSDGRRVTETEAIGTRFCDGCGTGHAVKPVRLPMLPGHTDAELAGITSGEFFPEIEP